MNKDKKFHVTIVAFVVIVSFAVCSISLAQQQPQQQPAHQQTVTENTKKPPAAPVVTPQDAAQLMRHTGGSLLQATMVTTADPGQAKLTDLSFFAVPDPEPKVMRKHDLVTIIVREISEFSSEGTTDLKKQADLNAKIDQFIQFSLDNFELKNSMGTPAEIKMSGDRNFKGEATVDRTDSLIARITAEVVDVKPNGTLILQARKRIKTDEEVQQFIMTGICRAEDILPDNTILSTQMYDLELNKTHKGAVRDTTKRGWVPKLLDAINPF
jgi:flagellar L-ring protein precursor FlgH